MEGRKKEIKAIICHEGNVESQNYY